MWRSFRAHSSSASSHNTQNKWKKTVRKYFFNLIFHSFEFRLSCKIVAFVDSVPERFTSSILENNIFLNKLVLLSNIPLHICVPACFSLDRAQRQACVKKRISDHKRALFVIVGDTSDTYFNAYFILFTDYCIITSTVARIERTNTIINYRCCGVI